MFEWMMQMMAAAQYEAALAEAQRRQMIMQAHLNSLQSSGLTQGAPGPRPRLGSTPVASPQSGFNISEYLERCRKEDDARLDMHRENQARDQARADLIREMNSGPTIAEQMAKPSFSAPPIDPPWKNW